MCPCLELHDLDDGPAVVAMTQRLERKSAYDAAYIVLADRLRRRAVDARWPACAQRRRARVAGAADPVVLSAFGRKSPTYAARSLLTEGEHQVGADGDDCVSSVARVSGSPPRRPLSARKRHSPLYPPGSNEKATRSCRPPLALSVRTERSLPNEPSPLSDGPNRRGLSGHVIAWARLGPSPWKAHWQTAATP